MMETITISVPLLGLFVVLAFVAGGVMGLAGGAMGNR